jgi:hypothetical protein
VQRRVVPPDRSRKQTEGASAGGRGRCFRRPTSPTARLLSKVAQWRNSWGPQRVFPGKSSSLRSLRPGAWRAAASEVAARHLQGKRWLENWLARHEGWSATPVQRCGRQGSPVAARSPAEKAPRHEGRFTAHGEHKHDGRPEWVNEGGIRRTGDGTTAQWHTTQAGEQKGSGGVLT